MGTEHDGCQCGCEEVYASICELMNGDLTPRRRAELKRQIEACPECVRTLGMEEEIRRLMRRCCCESAPSGLRQRITTSIRITRTAYYTSE